MAKVVEVVVRLLINCAVVPPRAFPPKMQTTKNDITVGMASGFDMVIKRAVELGNKNPIPNPAIEMPQKMTRGEEPILITKYPTATIKKLKLKIRAEFSLICPNSNDVIAPVRVRSTMAVPDSEGVPPISDIKKGPYNMHT